ncbi:hypothetical protein [Corynebacterium sp. CNJ-954]|uniref:hypothetical protein n=1 Tax=Corynebacterium sp. CNJ-954 TaxID=1904962 RepID=UPI0011153BA3|nr:hypothetical protein [Corynebacterium sp. CNJ-954]
MRNPASPGRGRDRPTDGPLVTTMIEGRPLLVDDATFIPEEVQALLLPVIACRSSLTVTDRPAETRITVAEGFCLILASKPGTSRASCADISHLHRGSCTEELRPASR